jgi:EAL domain-containing protein (putative c-di-GMP-specific phosphodiesterase class I)
MGRIAKSRVTNGKHETNEAARLVALNALQILDTAPEACFDTVARMAAMSLRTETASLAFVDQTRIWPKATWGGKLREFPRRQSNANRVVEENRPIVVSDLLQQIDRPGVTGLHKALGLRFFAGVPVRTGAGHVVGALCVRGYQPRPMVDPEELNVLTGLANLATELLELRQIRVASSKPSAPIRNSGKRLQIEPQVAVGAELDRGCWPRAEDIRLGLDRDEFVLFYQPEIELATRRIMGFEALIRWQHPKRGLVPPMHFIPQAEENGMILPLGDWGLAQACRQLQAWQNTCSQVDSLRVCVNLSARQFSREGLTDHVGSILLQNGLSGHHLALEMTESSLIPNLGTAMQTLTGIHRLGVSLHMDDFGTGYSSLNHLHRFPFDALKIDRSFVHRMGFGEQALQIVRTILELARALGMDVVAEGVETEEQLRMLREMGCRYGQGYLFAPPVPATDVTALLSRPNPYMEPSRTWARAAVIS